MAEVLALIPARSGSKGIAHKNIVSFGGKPMLAHSVGHARAATKVDRVVVSTDSELYGEIAREHGAEVPFLRPASLSEDLSTDLEAFDHALSWLSREEGYRPEICVHLRPTYPTRKPGEIDRAIALLESDPSFDSVRSIVEAPDTPFKIWWFGEDEQLQPVIQSDLIEPYNQPRQALPSTYLQNGCIDVVWEHVVREQRSMTGQRIRGMVMDHLHDIDSVEQFEAAVEKVLTGVQGKRFVVDIDGVIATLTPGNDYSLAEPIGPAIRLVNELHDAGALVILFTARGTMTGIDQSKLTRNQLSSWGVRYHELHFGKPAGDFYIDDRLLSVSQLERMLVELRTR